jgi:hypothetical protein
VLPLTDWVIDDLSFLRMSLVAHWRLRNRWRFSETARARFRCCVERPSCHCPSDAGARLFRSRVIRGHKPRCEWTSDDPEAKNATESSRSGTSDWCLGHRDNVRRSGRKSTQPLRARCRYREPHDRYSEPHDPGRPDNGAGWSYGGRRSCPFFSDRRHTYGCFAGASSNAHPPSRSTTSGVP